MDIEKIALEVASGMPTWGAGSVIPENYVKDFARRLLAKIGEEVEPKAFVTPLRYGSEVTFYKKNKPENWDDGDLGDEWYCRPLYATPAEAILAAEEKVSELQAWKDAVEHELILCGILSDDRHTDPKLAVADAIDWNVEAALDPAVSSEAVKLQEAVAEACAKYLLSKTGKISTEFDNPMEHRAEAIRAGVWREFL